MDLLRVAFLEWLLPLKHLTSPHELWDRFMADWSAIPGHELPVQSSRPATRSSPTCERCATATTWAR